MASQRDIYISLSSLMSRWDKLGDALLTQVQPNALFLFGSKRSWVFPETESERRESRKYPRYTQSKFQRLRDLIQEKEARDEVFWLKPEGFQYNGDLYHGDPEAFPKASDWLQRQEDPSTGTAFSPLQLDEDWWKTQFDPKTAKYDKKVDRIVKNFTCGAHDYAPLMELLHQSNPTLNIC
eukprot:TRINITY_DN16704_c0_g3_i2.p1 TRINITY_DN16704_c0_g3~~TRINITY_DN16704_c0_g3_i2.p1  ORF type:complete len:180 (+),score=27.85 TRINITY_DN16704_c0_g3_i2:82-621(+)